MALIWAKPRSLRPSFAVIISLVYPFPCSYSCIRISFTFHASFVPMYEYIVGDSRRRKKITQYTEPVCRRNLNPCVLHTCTYPYIVFEERISSIALIKYTRNFHSYQWLLYRLQIRIRS